MIVVVNYSSANFENIRRVNTLSAYKIGGADKVFEYSEKDIDEAFYLQNKQILDEKRGAGLWLWKPYFVLKTLRELDDNDYLFYCDSGSIFINKINKLIYLFDQYPDQQIIGFDLPMKSSQFTKRETFVKMGVDPKEENQVLATFILIRKCDSAIKFLEEWLEYCCVPELISPQNYSLSISESDNFVEHREDQSIFSILYRKYNFKSFRDPSNFGLRPFEYMWVENYTKKWPKWDFVPIKYVDCKYPQILIHNRSNNPYLFTLKEILKYLFWRLGIYNENYFKRKH